MNVKAWIEAMRLRTLPVSCSGVIVAAALAQAADALRWLPVALCLIFAILAQIASNFANEYYDFRDGLDRRGREGPRRGVTEGDITPRAMLMATFGTLATACAVGLSLVCFGGLWLIPAGIIIALGAIAYSAGPYPLSRHALGEPAVVTFFGIAPVCLTFYISTTTFDIDVLWFAVAVGLMGANVLIVNNYRDIADDRAVGKRTLATIIGPQRTSLMYLINGYLAVALMWPLLDSLPAYGWIAPLIYLAFHTLLWATMRRRHGRALNPILGMTAVNMLVFALLFAAETFAMP